MTTWMAIVAAGLLTYAIRLSMFALIPHGALPDVARQALRYVTPAVLAAIVLPAVLYVGEPTRFEASLANERFVAALVAAAVVALTRSVWLTIAAGMIALWLLTAAT